MTYLRSRSASKGFRARNQAMAARVPWFRRCHFGIRPPIGPRWPDSPGQLRGSGGLGKNATRFPNNHAGLEKLAPLLREIALHDARMPIGVAIYRIHKSLPRKLQGQLPSPEEIAKLLEGVE